MKPLSLTFIYCTARREPRFEWFRDSMAAEIRRTFGPIGPKEAPLKFIWVDLMARERGYDRIQNIQGIPVNHVVPKPSVWYGDHRLTKDHWWGKSSFLNTGLCLANTEWVCCVDDRCVLAPGFFAGIRDAIDEGYAVAGSYEKRINMHVENGAVVDFGTLIGEDSRNPKGHIRGPVKTYGDKWFGCCNALPLEWALQVGGSDESADSLGYEDAIFGHTLARNNYVVKYDPRLKVIQDRTMPDADILVKRTDKGHSPADKSHALETRTGGKKTATHSFDIRATRAIVQAGGEFPHHNGQPERDWWDNSLIKDFDEL